MTRRFRRILYLTLSALLVTIAASAQEATLSGSVTDTSGGVLPGVTVTATHTDSGNTFMAVTDGRGAFRLPLRTGEIKLTAELPGFATVTRTVQLLLGQEATLVLQMLPATLQETVTVTGGSPLIETTSSTVGGNIDPRQMQELPVNGRNWQDLALLAPGNRSNGIKDAPVERSGTGNFQINLDGQQVTQNVSGAAFGNPKFSRDAIAEFELVTNRFNATQGRSTGMQVNAITKSGTNTNRGSFAAYFRDDKFNAADKVLGRVVKYADQQFSGTYGGPIRKDRVHFFANLEFEREPQTNAYQTPYAKFNVDQVATRKEYTGGGRVDIQFSPSTRLSVRSNSWDNNIPLLESGSGASSASSTPSSAIQTHRWMHEVLGTLTHVVSDKAVNELKVGYAGYFWTLGSPLRSTWPASLQLPGDAPRDTSGPRILLRGLTIGPGHQYVPQEFNQETYSFRDNFTFSFDARGRHDLQFGGEYLHYPIWQYVCDQCFGQLTANVAALPANLEDIIGDVFDADTWNLAALSSIAISWQQTTGNFAASTPRYVAAGWVQDDWAVTPDLTLNLGMRYDLQLNVFQNAVEILPFLPGDRPNDVNNIAPRLGAVYSLNEQTVIRGGYGMFFGDISSTSNQYTKISSQTIKADVLNDGRPDFASNPFNGPMPSYEEMRTRICAPGVLPTGGCIRQALQSIPHPRLEIPFSHQASVGIQRQLGSGMAVTADYVFTGTRNDATSRNVNLTYNPATQSNYPFTDLTHLPFPDWSTVLQVSNNGRSNAHGLETSFTKRFSQGWQFGGNYTLSVLRDQNAPLFDDVELAPDLAGEYTLATTDQRHRVVMNGIWEVGRGFQVSGLYFYGSGQRFSTTWGPDLRFAGGGSESRLRPDGTIVPRNNFVGNPIHRVDMRLQERVPLGSRVKVDAVFEVFNAFNHANFGSYTTQESNARYGLPVTSLNVAYAPRTLQLGFRLTF